MSGGRAGRFGRRPLVATCALAVGIAWLSACEPAPGSTVTPPPPQVGFDYQLGGDGPLPAGAEFVVRQWSDGQAEPGVYSACYINAFQTEAEPDSPDGVNGWPAEVVLANLEDPDWPGEHPIDISTEAKRLIAADAVTTRLQTCVDKGFAGVEFDNLDSFTRYPTAPFDQADTIAYATLLVERAHGLGLAVGQKNTTDLLAVGKSQIGFDFVVVEQCGQYDECQPFVDVYGGHTYDIEYNATGLTKACAAIGTQASVIRRDRDLRAPGRPGRIYQTC